MKDLLTKLASLLQAAKLQSHNYHHLASRVGFFADHGEFKALYEAYDTHYDDVVERCIGLHGETAPLQQQLQLIIQELANIPAQPDNSAVFCNGTSWNVLSHTIGTPSTVLLHGGNGVGSTGTRIRRYSSQIQNTGNAIQYTDSATNGASFTINENGLYYIMRQDADASANALGISINASSLTTTSSDIATSEIILNNNSVVAGVLYNMSIMRNLVVGDIIRPHSYGTETATSDKTVRFQISLVNRK